MTHWWMFPIEQKIPGSPGDLRPDSYISNKDSGEAIIVDVTTSFEKVLIKGRSEKIDKYTHLVDLVKLQDRASCMCLSGSLGFSE